MHIGMTEASFWRATPRKLSALVAAYNRFHSEAEPEPRKATMGDLLGMGATISKG